MSTVEYQVYKLKFLAGSNIFRGHKQFIAANFMIRVYRFVQFRHVRKMGNGQMNLKDFNADRFCQVVLQLLTMRIKIGARLP